MGILKALGFGGPDIQPLSSTEDALAYLRPLMHFDWEPVGSRETCKPAPTDTDEDFLGYTLDFNGVCRKAQDFGFEYGGSHLMSHDGEVPFKFASLRLGRLNLIVTDDMEFYRRFLAASSVAKRLNLLRKADRIALFQAVLYGNACTESP